MMRNGNNRKRGRKKFLARSGTAVSISRESTEDENSPVSLMDIKWNYKLLDYGQTFIATLTVKEKIEWCTASEKYVLFNNGRRIVFLLQENPHFHTRHILK